MTTSATLATVASCSSPPVFKMPDEHLASPAGCTENRMTKIRWTGPALRIWAPDLDRLRRLALSAHAAGLPAACFLLSELNRAAPYESEHPSTDAVGVNSWVKFRVGDKRAVFWFSLTTFAIPKRTYRSCRPSELLLSDWALVRVCLLSIWTANYAW